MNVVIHNKFENNLIGKTKQKNNGRVMMKRIWSSFVNSTISFWAMWIRQRKINTSPLLYVDDFKKYLDKLDKTAAFF